MPRVKPKAFTDTQRLSARYVLQRAIRRYKLRIANLVRRFHSAAPHGSRNYWKHGRVSYWNRSL